MLSKVALALGAVAVATDAAAVPTSKERIAMLAKSKAHQRAEHLKLMEMKRMEAAAARERELEANKVDMSKMNKKQAAAHKYAEHRAAAKTKSDLLKKSKLGKFMLKKGSMRKLQTKRKLQNADYIKSCEDLDRLLYSQIPSGCESIARAKSDMYLATPGWLGVQATVQDCQKAVQDSGCSWQNGGSWQVFLYSDKGDKNCGCATGTTTDISALTATGENGWNGEVGVYRTYSCEAPQSYCQPKGRAASGLYKAAPGWIGTKTTVDECAKAIRARTDCPSNAFLYADYGDQNCACAVDGTTTTDYTEPAFADQGWNGEVGVYDKVECDVNADTRPACSAAEIQKAYAAGQFYGLTQRFNATNWGEESYDVEEDKWYCAKSETTKYSRDYELPSLKEGGEDSQFSTACDADAIAAYEKLIEEREAADTRECYDPAVHYKIEFYTDNACAKKLSDDANFKAGHMGDNVKPWIYQKPGCVTSNGTSSGGPNQPFAMYSVLDGNYYAMHWERVAAYYSGMVIDEVTGNINAYPDTYEKAYGDAKCTASKKYVDAEIARMETTGSSMSEIHHCEIGACCGAYKDATYEIPGDLWDAVNVQTQYATCGATDATKLDKKHVALTEAVNGVATYPSCRQSAYNSEQCAGGPTTVQIGRYFRVIAPTGAAAEEAAAESAALGLRSGVAALATATAAAFALLA